MVDDVFRSYRSHNTVAHDGKNTSREGISDLLVELARLTGQGDPYRDDGRDDGSFQAREDYTTPEQRQRRVNRYMGPSRRQPSSVPREPQTKPPSNRNLPRPTVKFSGFPSDAGDHPEPVNRRQYSDAGQQTSPGTKDRQQVLPRPRAPAFLPTVSDDRHDREMQSAETDEIHLADSFCNALPSPRWGRAMVIVLGLTWLGVASAYSYFAVFAGGAVLPTVRPLMAADNGPEENVPNYGDARTSSSSATSAKNAGSNEKFDSRWPADDQQPRKTALISSDPIALRATLPIARAASAPPPPLIPPALTALSIPVSERKKVHTIIIRSTGSEQTNTSDAAVAQSATSPRAPRRR